MAYVEAGAGRPIVLLHGNPTSSFLWRSVLPALQGLGRCVIPDLIGMGDSAKLGADDPQRYTFARRREFLDALLEVLGVGGDAVLVVHDWGSALGFDWARRHRGQVAAIAYMEALVRPFCGWDEWPPDARSIFQRLRSPAGEELILDRNVFVERILPASVLRPLTDQEMVSTAARSPSPATGGCPPSSGPGRFRSPGSRPMCTRPAPPTLLGCRPRPDCPSCSSTPSRAAS
jgi:haloalkane dehalogenase